MKFPNAAKGMKKIFTAEILILIAFACLLVGTILFLVGIAGTEYQGDAASMMAGGGMIGAVIFFVAFAVLAGISFILNLIGIINASRDEQNFKSALLFLFIGIVAVIISGFFTYTNPTVCSLLYSVFRLMEVFVVIFVISGGVKLADRLNNGAVSTKGTNVLKLIIVTKIIELIVSLIATFMGGMAASVTACILLIAAFVLSIIQYIMYLSFLSQAKKMLNKA